jgi:signal transduction histidine kinase
MWLRGKVTTVFAGCVVVPLALVLGAVSIGGGETLRDQAARDLKNATQSLATGVEARLALNLTHLKTFGALPIMQDVLIFDSGHEIQRTIVELKAQYPEFIDLFVADARGRIVAATSNNDMGRPAVTDEGFRAAASGSVHQGALTVREGDATAALSFSVPVIASYDRQSVIGALSGTIDLGAVARSVKAQSTLAAAQIALLIVRRQDGRIGFATHTDGTIAGLGQPGATTDQEISWRGAQHFVASAASTGKGLVRDPGFTVRVLMPAAATLGVIDQIFWIAAAAAFIAAAAALAFAWQWSTPLVVLGTAMERLVSGRDPGRTPQIAPTHMFGPMARAFESLRQSKTLHEWLSGRERDLARKKEQAEQALHQKSEHLASLTRALKSELATIVELSEAINAETLNAVSGVERASLAKDISRSGAQLLSVINDLFELSEAEAGHSTLRESEADLNPLVRESVAAMRDAAQKAKVKVACSVPDAPLAARIDVQKIRQVMFNLLSNAIKFTPEGGRVEVTLKTDVNGCPAIFIADTGIGMPANLSPLAAAPFGTVETNTHGRHGAGLGLPLVRKFVDMHGGTFEIESEPGKGTVVKVTLPPQRVVAPALEHDVLRMIA